MTGTIPRFTVILTSTVPLREVPASLVTVIEQGRGQAVEIILAFCSGGEFPEGVVAAYPDVTFIQLPQAAPLPALLGTALARAKGEIIAVTDVTCGVAEGWLSGVMKAHEAPHPVIGGAVEPEGLRTLVDWAAYFCDYGQFMLPLTEGVVREVPGNNLSLKRWVLAKGREFVEGEFWKTYWCRRIQAEGLYLYAVPSIVVSYRKSFGLWRYLVHRFHNGRCFAGMRTAGFGLGRRVGYLVGSPILPILFCLRFLKAVLPKRRYRRQLVLSFPIIILAMVSWALGEFWGYLSGPGTSCRHVR